MSPPWLAGITSSRDAECIDAVQPGLVLRIRRGRMVWFVRYLANPLPLGGRGQGEGVVARRYRIGDYPTVGLSAARKLASVVRGRVAAGDDPQAEKRAKQRNAVLPDDVSIHDIRRTVADALLNRIGTQPWIVDHVVLGHARPKLLRTYMPTLERILRPDGRIRAGDARTTPGMAGKRRARRDLFAEISSGLQNMRDHREGRVRLRTHHVESQAPPRRLCAGLANSKSARTSSRSLS
jgi:hypothetical protein